MRSLKTLLPWIILGAAGIAGGAWLASQASRPAPPELASGTWLPQPRTLGDIDLVASTGQPFGIDDFADGPNLVFFGFTHCPDVCPTTLVTLAAVKKAARIEDLDVYLISVDPERDTPELLARYVYAFDPEFIGLTGSVPAIEHVASQLSAARVKVPLPGGSYTIDHSATVYLLDGSRLVAVFTPPFDATRMAADLRAAAPRLGS